MILPLKDEQYSEVLKPLAPWFQFHVTGQLLKILICQKRYIGRYEVDMSQPVTQENHERDESKQWDPDIDLSHLTKDQQKAVRKVLREKCAVFAKDENDIGNATDLKLKINLSNDIPVKKSYISIPPPLYKEVKEYFKNLLVNGLDTEINFIICKSCCLCS